jgi:hypothetical protein
MVGLVVDSDRIWQNLVSLHPRRKTKALYGRIDVLGPTSPDLCVPPLGAVCILRRRQLRALTESAD